MMSNLSEKANNELNALYVYPGIRKITVEKSILREIMLHTGGDILVAGQTYDITQKSLGAGVYQLKLKKKEYSPMQSASNPIIKTVDIVFDGPPSHESGRFVEVENTETGESINYGEWIERDDGYWVLRMPRESKDILEAREQELRLVLGFFPMEEHGTALRKYLDKRLAQQESK